MNTSRGRQTFLGQVGLMRRSVMGGSLLLVWVCSTASWAGQTFPDSPTTKPSEQVGPPQPATKSTAGLRGREELEAEIRALELERTNLLAKYASAHPDVRLIERKLQARRQQLEALDATPGK